MAKLEKIVWIIGLTIIFVFAIFIRISKIGQIPAGFYADEAAIAYNGYSILQTGMDEYGKKWPMIFRSFGEYKTPTYSYLLMPIFQVFGKSVASARSLTVVSGLLTIIGIFILVKIWFKKNNVAFISSLVLATLPWHLIYSRSVYEVNLAILFIVWGLVFLELETKKVKWNWSIGFCLFALSIVTYNAARVIVPLIGIVWLALNIKEVFNKKNIQWFIFAVAIGMISLYPVWRVMFTSGFWERSGINIFNRENPWGYEGSFGIFYYHIREWASLYIAYLNPYYLFNLGDPGGRFRFVDVGLLFGWQLPFVFYGLKNLELEDKKVVKLLIGLLLISPIAASLTGDPVSSIRSLLMVIPLSIVVGLGISKFSDTYKWFGKLIVIFLFIFSLGRLYLSIFKMTDHYYFRDWDYGLQQLSYEIDKLPPDEQIVFVGPQLNYIQLVFFKANPAKYLTTNFTKVDDNYYKSGYWPTIKTINNIEVRDIVWKEDIFKKQILIFGEFGLDDGQIKEHCLSTIFEIKGLDNKRAYIGLGTNPELKLSSGKIGCK